MCFGDWVWGRGVGGGGVTQWSGTQPIDAVLRPVQLKNRSFQDLFF